MLFFPSAKINVGLKILNKRYDNYHNLESLFLPIKWYDVLEIIPQKTFKFMNSGLPIQIPNKEDNISVKVFKYLQNNYQIPNFYIHLHKNIPIGSGLGGGSADGTFSLLALNELAKLNISAEKLLQISTSLGSDCAFFISNKPQMAKGRGDILSPHIFSKTQEKYLKKLHVLVVFPNISIHTAWAFKNLIKKKTTLSLEEGLSQPIQEWKHHIYNDFEPIIFKTYPELKNIKNRLYEQGAIYASLSGSGSALYGFFEKAIELPFSKYLTWQGQFEF